MRRWLGIASLGLVTLDLGFTRLFAQGVTNSVSTNAVTTSKVVSGTTTNAAPVDLPASDSTNSVDSASDPLVPPPPVADPYERFFTMTNGELYNEIVKIATEGKQLDAERIVDQFVTKREDADNLSYLMGTFLRSRMNLQMADQYYEQAAHRNPQSVYGKVSLLIAEIEHRRDIKQNLESFKSYIEKNPDDPILLWSLALEYQRLGMTKFSEETYRKVMEKMKPGPVLMYEGLATCLDRQNRFKDSVELRKKEVELEPAAWSYQSLASTLSYLERYPEAEEAFGKAVEMDPKNAAVYINWGMSLFRQNKFDEAIEKCQKVFKLNPDDGQAYYLWGNCLESKKLYEGALDKYAHVPAGDPMNPAAQSRIEYINKLLHPQVAKPTPKKQTTPKVGSVKVKPKPTN